ncbi:hypothetical protein [Streptomyces tibetensis]|uniref:hypothetical protein n=1 Tax=Streptomyces tibetensis TaxID=2382123 RepID=UPI0033FA4A4A
MSNELNRRSFVGRATAVAGAAAMAPLLSACGNGGEQQTGSNTASELKKAMPAYVPSQSLKPDIPSVSNGADLATDPGFLRYPTEHPTTVSGVPGKGGKYTAVTPLWGTVPPPGNSFYQAMNKALGVDLTIKPADGNNYATIIPTMTAAKRLPDWIQLPTWWNSQFAVGQLAGTQLAGPDAPPVRRQDQEVPQPGRDSHRRLEGRCLEKQAVRHTLRGQPESAHDLLTDAPVSELPPGGCVVLRIA